MAGFLFHLFHRRAPIFNFLLGLKIIANRPGSWIVLPLQISWAARALRTFVFHTPNPRISMFWPEIRAALIISNTVSRYFLVWISVRPSHPANARAISTFRILSPPLLSNHPSNQFYRPVFP